MSKKKQEQVIGGLPLRTLVASSGALRMLSQQHLPAAMAFRLGRILRLVDGVLEQYETQRAALVRQFGVEDDNGNVSVPAEAMDDFNAQLQPLLDEEVAIDHPPLPLSALDGHVLQPAHLMYLDWLFDEAANEDDKEN